MAEINKDEIKKEAQEFINEAGDKAQEIAADVSKEAKEFIGEAGDKAQAIAADVSREAKEAVADVTKEAKEFAANPQAEAKEAFAEIKEEAAEVVQEARAAASGQPLETAGTEGGAGYRAPNSQSSGNATASLVLGIVSIIAAFIFPIVGIIAGIVGTYLGAKARKEVQTGIATGGFVCSIVGLALNAVVFICAIAVLGTVGCAGLASTM